MKVEEVSLKRKIYSLCSMPIIKMFNFANTFNTELAQSFSLIHEQYVTKSKKIKLYCPNRVVLWRARTLLTKEPETINWMNDYIQPGDIFFDVGANIGLYSLYAACMEAQVFSFEPEAQNYALLNKNIFLNNLENKVQGFCIAISDKQGFDALYLSQYIPGYAMHNFGEEVDFNHNKFQSCFKQGVPSFSLDELVEQKYVPIPHHIKIDVDGIENKVIAGSKRTLSRPELRSVLIELNEELECDQEIITMFSDLGFERKLYSINERTDHLQHVKNFIFVRV